VGSRKLARRIGLFTIVGIQMRAKVDQHALLPKALYTGRLESWPGYRFSGHLHATDVLGFQLQV
jgi:hypothetical protein